ncbi:hypothetical protein QFZ97_006646 [Paraburkholderia youngii]
MTASAIARRLNSKTCLRKINSHRNASCPPAGSVIVVRLRTTRDSTLYGGSVPHQTQLQIYPLERSSLSPAKAADRLPSRYWSDREFVWRPGNVAAKTQRLLYWALRRAQIASRPALAAKRLGRAGPRRDARVGAHELRARRAHRRSPIRVHKAVRRRACVRGAPAAKRATRTDVRGQATALGSFRASTRRRIGIQAPGAIQVRNWRAAPEPRVRGDRPCEAKKSGPYNLGGNSVARQRSRCAFHQAITVLEKSLVTRSKSRRLAWNDVGSPAVW